MPNTQERPVLYKPHDGPQTEFHERDEDFILFGGSKFPGKTHALLFEATRQIDKANYKAIILRRTFPRLQEIIDRAQEFFPKMGGRWEGDSKRWKFKSGATIAFGHCEHENSKYQYQGQQYAFIGYDQIEEFTESQVRYINAQCRTADATIRCYIRATANPGGEGHWWIKRKFIQSKKPRQRYEEDFGVYEGKRLVWSMAYIPATIFDNPTGLQANPQYLANLKSLPEQERKAFLDGDWDAFDTGCAFDAAGLLAQEKMIRPFEWVGYLRDTPGRGAEPIFDEKGPLSIFKHPAVGSQYFIAADVAKGVEGGDFSVGIVIDRSNWEVVAKFKDRIEPMEFARVLYGIGFFYNTAKIAVEVWPGPGLATGAELLRLDYPIEALYRRMTWDGEKRITKADIGWVTDERARYDLITSLQNAITHKRILIRDQECLDEIRSFVRNERGRYEARSGCHDDHVIALGIACFCMTHDPIEDMIQGAKGASRSVGSVVPPLNGHAQHGKLWRARQNGRI